MNKLQNLRKQIDVIDKKIIGLLSKRLAIVNKVGRYKKVNNMKPLDKKRFKDLIDSRKKIAERLGVSRELIVEIWEKIHEEALKLEKNI